MAGEPIRIEAEFGIEPGRLDDVRGLLGELQQVADRAQPGALSTSLATDCGSVDVRIDMAGADLLDALVRDLGPVLTRVDGPAHLAQLHVYGTLSAPAAAAFERFSPQVHAYSS